jgi:hypothetical protein
MARNRRFLRAGLAAVLLAGSTPAWAGSENPCPERDLHQCLRDMLAAGCGGAGTGTWCDPIHGGLVRLDWASRALLKEAPLTTPALAMHQVASQVLLQPLEVGFTQAGEGIAFPGGEPPLFARLSGGAAGEGVAYLASPAFGAVMREAQHPGPAHAVRLDSPALNGRADAIVVATRVGLPWSTHSATGAYYDGWHWWLYNESLAPMAADEMFFYAEATGLGGRVVHTAQNDFWGIGVYLDDPRLNGNPGAAFVAQHAYAGQVNVSPLGAWYDSGRGLWVVFNELGSPLAAGEQIHYITTP